MAFISVPALQSQKNLSFNETHKNFLCFQKPGTISVNQLQFLQNYSKEKHFYIQTLKFSSCAMCNVQFSSYSYGQYFSIIQYMPLWNLNLSIATFLLFFFF